MANVLHSRLFQVSALIVVVAAIVPVWLSAYIVGVLTVACYYGVFSMAWDLLFGFAGEVNFGPTFLIGLGAYAAALLDNQLHWPIALCVAAGAIAALILWVWLLGRYFPGSGLEQLGMRSAREITEDREALEAEDLS
ncbi:MAG: hypothetical protein ABR591_06930, partial [Candidatus Velthaea sp.]